MAIFGDQITKLIIERQAAQFSQKLRDALSSVKEYQAWLQGVADADLVSAGFTTSDIALLRGAFWDGSALATVAGGHLPPPAATGVKVYRGTATGAENVLVATLGPVTGYIDTGSAGNVLPVTNTAVVLPPSNLAVASMGAGSFSTGTYYWKITGTTSAGETTASNEFSQFVSSGESLTLGWASLPAGTTGVKVYRGTTAGAENVLVATLGAVTTYTDTGSAGTAGSPPGTNTAAIGVPSSLSAAAAAGGGFFGAGTYYWRITGTDANGETTGSNETSATVAAGGVANLGWASLPAGTTGVKVYRGMSAGGETALIDTIGAVISYTDVGLPGTQAVGVPTVDTAQLPAPSGLAVTADSSGGTFAAGTYYWKVTAVNALGETAGSLEASATLVSSGAATLTWNALPQGYPQPAGSYPYLANVTALIGPQ